MRSPPVFDEAFCAHLRELLTWRRDVRRFRREPLPPGAVERLIELASLAPSVGLSQPWRFVAVEDPPAAPRFGAISSPPTPPRWPPRRRNARRNMRG